MNNTPNEILTAYDAGYDCGMNGADLINSSYKWFSNKHDTELWELGKKDAENKKSTKKWKIK